MIRIALYWLALLSAALTATTANAATDIALTVPATPSVAVTGSATGKIQNDRMVATLRVEAEHASAAAAASEVNTRMARALNQAKAVPSVDVKSAGYNTWQSWEKGRPSKWKVVQSVAFTGGDFAALAVLVSKLQDEDGLLVSSISFAVAPETRRKAEDALIREAIRAWQQRAATASDSLGYASWRPGRVQVSTSDALALPRSDQMMRAQAAPAAAAPIAVEGGTTDLTVTVSGEAILDSLKPR